ncbi:tRNA (adenine-N1)-methyltransferase [Candidatus Bathyarchaeota archaeon]|jgi:tRNA (adenine57-N1/adenine58-N1)-methyltransferase catalytic subunit|nr:tRNA (adenine-N1)-methyltransferase [Candidatus Bathyarchaeota archaeon]MBT4320506.1 tRNA (adenine-N1)-methyltransferase [Candidatus Bathyarchaeota archaeon]MBT4424906.1 tRNA (adenine-N1)-methyltransferase [Candidatus Bathyarchaeota archaeon]MBT6605334.1 tRNA (adenine-N1)-methyltransferase [Candidatus Bathyarchaeota archaeon]MBT7187692.1 tRNA (adenine-N1)-methyltransferase [Candidatus Bathyarchaeota archaeon]
MRYIPERLFTSNMTNIKEGDEIYLVFDHKQNYKLKVVTGEKFHTRKGFIELGDLIGKPFGMVVTSSLGMAFYVLKPLIRDRVLKTDRRTQVLYPKDISYILLQMDLGSGSQVVEAGTGSGALTMAMANSVRPNGMIYSYDISERHQKVAARNIDKSGLMPWVELEIKDITKGIPNKDVDAVFLDMSQPWKVVRSAWDALAGSGVFMSFSPTIDQVMKTTEMLNSLPFIEIETIELLLREITVAPNKTRPRTQMIGHSGYLTSARKVIELLE